MEDTVNDSPPGESDVCQIDLQGNAASSLRLLPVVENLRVSSHRPDRVGGPVIQLVSQVSGSDLHGGLEPLVQVVSLGGMSGPGLTSHSTLQPVV